MSERVYNRGKFRLGTGATVWGSADTRILQLETTAAGAFDPDLNTVADLLAVVGVAELVAVNYVRKALTAEAVAEDDANDRVNYDGDISVYTSLGAPTGDAIVASVVYDEGGGTDATRHLISYHDSGFPISLNGGNFTETTPNDIVRAT